MKTVIEKKKSYINTKNFQQLFKFLSNLFLHVYFKSNKLYTRHFPHDTWHVKYPVTQVQMVPQ